MPTSGHAQISLILEIVHRLKPGSILEIGTGYGKYGALLREYFPNAHIEGIEGHARYVGTLHDVVYNVVHIGDARAILAGLNRSFDLVLMIDVFEHLTREDGTRVLQECHRLGKSIIISVPATWDAQDGGEVNPYETHRAQYAAADFSADGFQVTRFADHIIALHSDTRVNLRPVVARWAIAVLAPGVTDVVVRVRDRLRGVTSPRNATW